MPVKKWSLSRFVGPRAFDGRLEINWSHPLSRGLVVCLLHNTGGGPGNTTTVTAVPNFDLVRSHLVNTPIVNRGAGHRGLGTLLSTGNITEFIEITAHADLLWSSTDSFAIVSLAAFNGNSFPRIWESDTYIASRPLVSFRINSNVLEWYYGNTLTGLVSAIGATTLSASLEPKMWIASKDVAASSNHSKTFINGLLEAQSTDSAIAWGPLTNDFMTTRSAGGSNGVESWKGLRHLDYFYRGRAISNDDARWLSAEPYAMLQSRPRRTYFSAAPSNLTESLSDTLAFTDAIALFNAGAISLSDALSLSDQLQYSIERRLLFTDHLTFSDFYASNMIALNDTLQFSDFLSLLNIVSLSFNDSITITDHLDYQVIIPLLFADSLSFSDFLATSSAHIARLASDFLQFLDSVALFKTGGSNFTDQLVFADSNRIVLGINIGLSDQLVFLDSLLENIASNIGIGLSDTLVFSDSVIVAPSTSNDNYLRRYLNDAVVVEPTETVAFNPPTVLDADEEDYLRRYLNDKDA